MKLICSRDRLMEAISIVQKAVATRSTLPILDGILLEAKNGVILTGYDLETGIECHIEADVPEAGSIVVNARMFGDIIRKLPDDIVTIETGHNLALQIECGSTHFSIKGIRADDYPKIPVVEEEQQLVVKQNLLKDMIRQTLFAVSTDESRPVLNGCFLNCDGKNLEMVAIDGFRLALRKNEIGEGLPVMKFIIPGKALNEVGRILQSNESPVEIYPSQNHIRFDTGRVKLVSRLIQGEYMNYKGIIPQTAETTMTISPAAMLAAIERASLVITTEERRFPVRLTMPDDETLVVSANTEIGTLREEINVSMTGNRIDIDFNPRYFVDALKAIDEDEISVVFNGSMGPCVLKPADSQEFAYLVLPLRR
ncbi:MAG TPA: DNA polymerase III subunit beta [Clostridiales bacterium]|nr:DNA polymerase III subunit beta [Clostridiales bacterium]